MKPATFLWKDDRSVLVYDTEELSCEVFKRGKVLDEITDRLSETDNLYCIELTSADIEADELHYFISTISQSGSGGLLEKAKYPNGKPAFLKPILSIQESYEHKKKYEELHWEDNYLDNLLGLNLYLDGKAENGINYRQFPYPHYIEQKLTVKPVLKLLEKVRYSSCFSIGIISNFSEDFPGFTDLMNSLDTISALKIFYCKPDALGENSYLLSAIGQGQFRAVVYLDEDTREYDVFGLSKRLSHLSGSLEFKFLLSDNMGLKKNNQFKQLLKGFEFKTIPVYNGTNLTFFKENVFLTKEDVLRTKLKKRQIFARQAMNVKDFGGLSVFPDGMVYANVNNPALGRIEDGLLKLIRQEFENGESWFKTREKVGPCKDCVFKYLCPPVSNYEYVMGRYNLCHLKVRDRTVTEALV